MTGSEREIGALSARLAALEDDVREVSRDVRDIRDALATVRGGWKALTLIVAVSAALGGLVAKVLPFLAGARP